MSEPHKISTPKTCPLYGATFLRVESKLKGIQIGTQQATIPQLVGCNEKHCQWWDESKNDCTVRILTFAVHNMTTYVADLGQTLERITNLLYDKGGK